MSILGELCSAWKVVGCQYSPDGDCLAINTYQGIELRDGATLALRSFLSGPYLVGGLTPVFSPDGRLVASVFHPRRFEGDGLTLWIWDIKTEEAVRKIDFSGDFFTSLAIDERNRVTIYNGRFIRSWNVEGSVESLPRLVPMNATYGSGLMHGYATNPDGSLIASLESPCLIGVWNKNVRCAPLSLRVAPGHESLRILGFSQDNDVLVTSENKRVIQLRETRSGSVIKSIEVAERFIWATLSPDQRHLAVSYLSGTLDLWNLETGRVESSRIGPMNWAKCVAHNTDTSTIAAGYLDHTVRLWDSQLGRDRLTLTGHSDAVHCVALSKDGKLVVSGSQDGTARIWDTVTGRELCVLSDHGGGVRSVAFSSDGATIITAADDGKLRFWDSQRGISTYRFSFSEMKPASMACDVDGNVFAAGFSDGTVAVWRIEVTDIALVFTERVSANAYYLALNQTRDVVAAASSDGSITLWDIETGRQLRVFQLDATCLAFVPSGELLAGLEDGRVVSCDLITGQVTDLEGRYISCSPPDPLTCVSYLPDGCAVHGFRDGELFIVEISRKQ